MHVLCKILSRQPLLTMLRDHAAPTGQHLHKQHIHKWVVWDSWYYIQWSSYKCMEWGKFLVCITSWLVLLSPPSHTATTVGGAYLWDFLKLHFKVQSVQVAITYIVKVLFVWTLIIETKLWLFSGHVASGEWSKCFYVVSIIPCQVFTHTELIISPPSHSGIYSTFLWDCYNSISKFSWVQLGSCGKCEYSFFKH